MSNSLRTLHLHPTPGDAPDERIIERHLLCPRCRGNRVFFIEVAHGEFDEQACSTCCGSGYLKAEINITYSPDTDIY